MPLSETNLATILVAQRTAASENEAAAQAAMTEGHPEARMFHALALGQKLHADKAKAMLSGLGYTSDTDVGTLDHQQVMESLPDMILTAARERQPSVESLLTQIMKSAISHDAMTRRTHTAGSYHVCMVCGFIATESAPERCPVCRAQAAQFEAVR